MSHRLHHVDGLKVLASQLIVLHHFTAYGPLAEALDRAAPQLTDYIFEYGRMAVQIFLVIGGYFAASALAPHGSFQRSAPWRLLVNRYVRLVPPLLAALVLVGMCSAAVGPWLDGEFLPAQASPGQVLAHAFLLHDILGVSSLSVGTWYVAMDFQLFAFTLALLWVGGRSGRWLVAGVMVASLFYFNRFPGTDMWATYFFGAYGMGLVAWWAGRSRHAKYWLIALALVGLAALLWDFRTRIALALATAVWLGWARWRMAVPGHDDRTSPRLAGWLRASGRSAYALFLTHFAVWILANGVWSATGAHTATAAAFVCLAAWVACLGVAVMFERYVERPMMGWRLPP